MSDKKYIRELIKRIDEFNMDNCDVTRYIHMSIINSANEKFRFGTADGSTITVEKLILSELE